MFQCGSILVSSLGNLGCSIISNVWVKSGYQHQGLVQQAVDLFPVGHNAHHTVVSEGLTRVTKQADGAENIGHHHGLEDVQFKMSIRPTNSHSHMITHDLACHHSDSLTLGRVHFAIHDGAAQHIKSPRYLHHGIMSCKSLKLVRSRYKGQPSEIRDLGSHLLSKAYPGVKPCTHSSASSGQHVQSGEGGLHTLNSKLKLCHIARELLSKSKRGGILGVGSANLNDVCILLSLGIQSIVQLLDPWKQHIVDLHSNRDVHGSRVGVIAALGLVHMVIRMNRSLAAKLSSKNLNGPVRDDLIGVHVGLGARASLPDDQWEMVIIERARNDLISSLADGSSNNRVKTIFLVDLCSSFLEHSKSLDDWQWHSL